MSTKGISEIPVYVDGVQKWVTGLTPKTTCDDVIHSLLINMGCPMPHEAVFDYALFENWRGIERPLKGRSKFIKLRKDWGSDGNKVELTMRKIDSTIKNDICGTLKKHKGKKSWFKFRDSSSKQQKQIPLARSMRDVINPMDNVTSIHEDSSLMMQNKENLFCAFRCYSKKKSQRGLKERSANLRTPFERPRSVAVVQPHDYTGSVAIGNPMYNDAITCIYNSRDKCMPPPESKIHAQYSSTASLKKTNSVYGSTATLRQIDTVYKRQSVAVPDNTYEPLYSTTREQFARGQYTDHLYDYPKPRVVGRRAVQNPVDWDYDYDKHIDYFGESDSADSDHEEEENIYSHANNEQYTGSRFKGILDLVLCQERKIQEQFMRIKKADKQIEEYEIKMHNARASEEGKDYLQETYLKDGENLLASQIPAHEMNAYESMVENLVHMDNKIIEQYNKIEDLSTMLHNESQLNDTLRNGSVGPFESTRIDPAIQKQLDELKDRLQETANRSVCQEREMQEIDSYLGSYEQQLLAKQRELEAIIEEIEQSSEAKESTEAPRQSQSQNHVLPGLSSELRQSETVIRDILSSVTKKPQAGKSSSTSSLVSTASQHRNSHTTERKSHSTSALPRPQFFQDNFSEMGIDVGSSTILPKCDSIPDKQCDNEIESILQCRRAPHHPTAGGATNTVGFRSRDNTPRLCRSRDITPRLCRSREGTPLVGTLSRDGTPLGTSVNAIVEYHNETVDLDSICNYAMRQKTAKLSTENRVNVFKPIVQKKVVEQPSCVQSVHNITDDNKDIQSAIHASFSSAHTTPLPPVGMESMAKLFSKKLMPDFTADLPDKTSTEGDRNSSNNSCDSNVGSNTTTKDTLSQTIHFNETSVWATQDDGIDVTFTLPHHHQGPLDDDTADTFFISQNKSNTLLESNNNTTIDVCDNTADQSSFVASKPPRPQHQKPKVKKRLFEDSASSSIYHSEAVCREIKDIMSSLTGDVSNSSRLSDSGESGVGSLPGDSNSSGDNSSISWTSSCSTTSTRSIETTV